MYSVFMVCRIYLQVLQLFPEQPEQQSPPQELPALLTKEISFRKSGEEQWGHVTFPSH
jgi:hypothetical protein